MYIHFDDIYNAGNGYDVNSSEQETGLRGRVRGKFTEHVNHHRLVHGKQRDEQILGNSNANP